MADTASKLQISELDFDTIKSNLKNFLSDQNEFSDHNFDGKCFVTPVPNQFFPQALRHFA